MTLLSGRGGRLYDTPMKLGDIANPAASEFGKPLDGVRILAVEQMQALPYGTQLLSRLGADVVKVEHPVDGESGRGSLPAMDDPWGRRCGATYLRNALNKRSVGIDLKNPKGKELLLALVPHYDVVAENFRAGTMKRLGLGYEDIAAVHPSVIYTSVSGFGNTVDSPYDTWAAYAPIAEAMSGLYGYKQVEGEPPMLSPAGALGDISSALFATIGILAALRHRDVTGEGQYVDVSMLDSMVAMSDLVINFWSMGMRPDGLGPLLIMDGFIATDGWFVVQVGREHQFAKLAEIIGHPEWLEDPRLAERKGWRIHLDDIIRPAINEWAQGRTKLECCHILNGAGVAAGPVNNAEDVIADPHVAARNMIVEIPRTDGVKDPILIPGNPVKMTKVTEGPETRPAWLGEHTYEILRSDLGLSDSEPENLSSEGVINPELVDP